MSIRILALSIISLTILFSCDIFEPKDSKPDSSIVTIGTQVWMTKNLDVGHYRNGDSIPEVRDSATWVNLRTGAWCYYNNDPAMGKIYGKLYNWYAVNDPRGLAPAGWHIPSDLEWATLINYLGGDSIAGGKLKERGTAHWASPNTGATNESGFTALPGLFSTDSDEGDLTGSCILWSSTKLNNSKVFCIKLSYNSTGVVVYDGDIGKGMPVRCLKDN